MKRLGEILIEHGALDAKQLEDALKKQKESPQKLLGEVLREMGIVTEEDIVVALASQFHVPYLPLRSFVPVEEVAKLIPRDLIKKHLCFPIDKIGHLLTVAMVDPTNEHALEDLAQATKCKVQPFVSTATEIANLIERYLGIPLGSLAKKEDDLSKATFHSAVTKKQAEKPVKSTDKTRD